MKRFIKIIGLTTFFISCSTTMELGAVNESDFLTGAENIEEELEQNEAEEKGILVQEELKIQDIPETVIFVEKPVYVPENKTEESDEPEKLTGKDAVLKSVKESIVKPESYKKGTFFYQYNENFVYEVYAQPYHLTDIELERGEVVIGTPLLSEDESVWELTAGVAKDPYTGESIQHLFIKPAYSALDSTLIIITDRRVYHFRIKSYQDTHMAMVKFTYPLQKNVWATKADNNGRKIQNKYVRTTNPEFLSFDYTMKYSRFKKPEFLPTQVYDDGQQTYIAIDEIVLQKKLPVLFNEKNEIVNYSVQKNVLIIPRLINKLTLRLGKEKVTVEKKIFHPVIETPQEDISGN